MAIKLNLLKEIASKDRSAIGEDINIKEVFIDSRKEVQNGLFIPIVGDRFDGHSFLLGAIKNGAIATLWEEGKELPSGLPENFPIFFVKDTLKALEQLARVYLQEVAPIVIGVTGSNGKTSTKDLIEAVLTTEFKTHKTAGNYNNHIGLPLTILSMPKECEVIILEMGMNNFGEISFLSNLAKPDLAIITNIGESHIEQLGSREGISKAKLEIVDGLKNDGVLILDGDEPLLLGEKSAQTITCGYGESNDYRISNIEQKSNLTRFSINEQDHYTIRLLGKHNIKNSSYAIAVAKYLGMNEHTIQVGLNNCVLTGMRMEKQQGLNGSIIINDAYNSSPTSMKAAIETMKQLDGFQRRVLVLGDMYELGNDEKELHRSVASVISTPITHLLTVGDKGKWIAEALLESNNDKIEVNSYHSKEELTKHIKPLLDHGSIVLIKASRGMKLETIAKDLY
ncbi:UDP-N-acetylmuramoyl-tripeptide--D-alanyl-D-alanine ligase [Anaerobacillus alkaliphilus]|uniref:UDP-N-acetylmuramoyl-tripeptide--D-alanyl-D-alanine ligase n=1 Tax=Anaerobacillus alkaliphilus TaxID=1548597 RepID=A0A4Q0VNW6_9BACI|nr:UDP-N-acetylmuramoyl-tripeptide--D-alanyl-D-alanine ligase [Anaerobacillus alkaliphilus]RXI98106.1 UDP-N-acetylmuramoyl-tripeptide--D-alanyl-D-alanine ligase [Anaerobacillus alkaliphilus]